MSEYWTPANISFIASNTPQVIMSVSIANGKLARIVNANATAISFIGLVTAAATAGESQSIPIAPGVSFFLAYGAPFTSIVATGATTYVQDGYALK